MSCFEPCLTCSDMAVRATVVSLLEDGLARVEVEGAWEEVALDLVEADVGDVVLVHAKVAIGRIG